MTEIRTVEVGASREKRDPLSLVSVLVPVVCVWDVGVVVGERRMPMLVAVRLARGVVNEVVVVLVVLVVHVQVLVSEFLVYVPMCMPFSQEQRETHGHHAHREPICPAQRVAQQSHRAHSTDEGSSREEGSFSCGPDEPKRVGIEDDADPVAEAPEDERAQHEAPWRERSGDEEKAQCRVRDASHEGLDAHDGERVPQGEPLGEVVVD